MVQSKLGNLQIVGNNLVFKKLLTPVKVLTLFSVPEYKNLVTTLLSELVSHLFMVLKKSVHGHIAFPSERF